MQEGDGWCGPAIGKTTGVGCGVGWPVMVVGRRFCPA